jgi:hypothetical protein
MNIHTHMAVDHIEMGLILFITSNNSAVGEHAWNRKGIGSVSNVLESGRSRSAS